MHVPFACGKASKQNLCLGPTCSHPRTMWRIPWAGAGSEISVPGTSEPPQTLLTSSAAFCKAAERPIRSGTSTQISGGSGGHQGSAGMPGRAPGVAASVPTGRQPASWVSHSTGRMQLAGGRVKCGDQAGAGHGSQAVQPSTVSRADIGPGCRVLGQVRARPRHGALSQQLCHHLAFASPSRSWMCGQCLIAVIMSKQ